MKKTFQLDFVGIGVERSATTWLSECLRAHPQIFIPEEKELYYFNETDPHFLKFKNLKYKRGIAWYKSFFKSAQKDQLKGEFSPTYLYSKVATDRIKKDFPNVKIIVSLRNPTDRAFSQYLHDKHIGVIPSALLFEDAIKKYPNYLEKGMYTKYLQFVFKNFPKKNICIVLYDDIKKSPKKVLQKIYRFLGVDSTFIPTNADEVVYPAVSAQFPFLNYVLIHTEYILRNNYLQPVLRILEITGVRRLAFRINNYINTKPLEKYPRMKESTRKRLNKLYHESVNDLEKLAKLQLGAWKK